MTKKKTPEKYDLTINKNQIALNEQNLFEELSDLISRSRERVYVYANSEMNLVFWQVGKRINDFILNNKRAEYGKQIVVTLSRQLEQRHGKNFEERNLRRIIQFAEIFDDYNIVATLSPQLSWSHLIVLFTVKKKEALMFYAQKAASEIWSVRDLRKNISKKVYERTLIAGVQPVIAGNLKSVAEFKDPYFFDFLKMKSDFLEKDLESAILNDLENFIMELGRGFAFVERQKRMIIDGDDFYLDLLFYNRNLKRLVAIELKIGKFQAKYKGQMELYLKWLNKYERKEDEASPVGLILCTETSREQIELLEMHKDGILVAEYWTELPPRKILEEKIKVAVEEAKERIERLKLLNE
jgi:predicted nuclease of restriction endonuclease-like (RecB) superfamily